ncbi:hypothetical protein [Nannocystis radixulma]|uniref:HEAT repeat domain-containing protein n=1 Tax=Nannocystis radixulma TaxID=2995305 RepID=A0ABT5BPC9_9BACT|nr:hypothetical protein [Nannocystis radixulma]MDC0676020.1 hypothetical protein [Nannocystis radixulma]
MGEPTPILRTSGTPFLCVDVQPTPGRAPRLELEFATTRAALDSYSSQYAPTGLLAHRIRRGDLGALDDLARALATVAHDEAHHVGYAYGSIVAELLREPPRLAPLTAWLARCLADERLPHGVRTGLAAAIAIDPLIPSEPTIDALFASRLVDDATCATYFGSWQRSLEHLPLARVIAVARAALPGGWNPALAAAATALGRLVRPDVTAELRAMLEIARDDDNRQRLLDALARHTAPPASAADRDDVAPPPADPGVTVGLGLVFDTETDVYPNGHDCLLRRLAGLAAPVLDDVLFEEVPHVESDDDDDDDDADDADPDQLRDAYRLRAFLPECTFEIIAGDRSDWLDVPAMLGLLNTLCSARGLDIRFVALPTDSQDAHVIAAPAGAILRALADGSLVLAEADAAATFGRAYERAAFAAIQARRR